MKHKKETWAWELELMFHYVLIIIAGCVLAGILGGKGFWESEIANMKEQLPATLFCLAWLVGIPISGLLLRRYFFCWSGQAKRFSREKQEHRERMKKYDDGDGMKWIYDRTQALKENDQ